MIYVWHCLSLIQFFPGQSGGKAIADVIFGDFNPGARLPISVPYSSGALPDYYKYVAIQIAENTRSDIGG